MEKKAPGCGYRSLSVPLPPVLSALGGRRTLVSTYQKPAEREDGWPQGTPGGVKVYVLNPHELREGWALSPSLRNAPEVALIHFQRSHDWWLVGVTYHKTLWQVTAAPPICTGHAGLRMWLKRDMRAYRDSRSLTSFGFKARRSSPNNLSVLSPLNTHLGPCYDGPIEALSTRGHAE